MRSPGRPFSLVLLVGALLARPAAAGELPPLRTGDLVFQTSRSSQSEAIGLATGSPYTHVGLVRVDGGATFVVEAASTVRVVPLEGWIARGEGGRVAILRDPGLTAEQRERPWKAARELRGRPYDPFFLFDEQRIYCSELVHRAYRTIGIELGEIERLGQLATGSEAVRVLLDARWSRHPGCRGASRLADCERTLLDQRLVTPAALARDPRLVVVHSSFRGRGGPRARGNRHTSRGGRSSP